VLKQIINIAEEKNVPIFIVGGIIRDLFLKRRHYHLDIDLVIDGNAIAFANSIQFLLGGELSYYSQFGTATMSINYIQQIDFITARKETYPYPGALPLVTQSNIYDDLLRRDFTINALAARLNNIGRSELIDLCSGIRDIKLKTVRTLHALSFKDDPTRILRAVRYEQRYHFQISAKTLEELNKYKSYLSIISPHRIKHEFDRIFTEADSSSIMERLNNLSILNEIHSALSWNKQHTTCLRNIPANFPEEFWDVQQNRLFLWLRYVLWLMPYKANFQEIASRFNLEQSLNKIILSTILLSEQLTTTEGYSISEVVELLDKCPPMSIYAYYLITANNGVKEFLVEYMKRYKKVAPSLAAKEQVIKNVKAGAIIGILFNTIRNAWLDGEIKNTQQEMILVKRLIQK